MIESFVIITETEQYNRKRTDEIFMIFIHVFQIGTNCEPSIEFLEVLTELLEKTSRVGSTFSFQ
jgi:hypothetical protein